MTAERVAVLVGNEAAERFRATHGNGAPRLLREFDAALLAERAATVERIRTAVKEASFWESWLIDPDRAEFLAILDAEAAR